MPNPDAVKKTAEITAILAMLASSYPRFKLEKETVAVYIRLLADIPAEELRVAAIQCASTLDFFPSVHELRRAMADARREREGIPTAYQAWEDMLHAWDGERSMIEEPAPGAYYITHRIFTWSHPLVEQAARSLGWPKRFPGDNESTDRAHFTRAYNDLVDAWLREQLTLPEVRLFIEQSRIKLLESRLS